MQQQANGWASRRTRLLLWTLGGLWLLWLLVGLFVLPGLAREPLTRTLADLTGREVRLGDIAFNPLGLAVELEELTLLDADGRPMIRVPRFYADFELSSLFRWSLYLDVVEIGQPEVFLRRDQQGFNLASLGPDTESGKTEAEEQGGAPAFPLSIGVLELDSGRFVFRDETRETPMEIEFSPLGLTLEDFTTRGADEDDNSFLVSVAAPRGGTLSWSGRFGLQPFSSRGELALDGVALAPFSPLIPRRLAVKASGGRLDMETSYRLAAGGDGGLTLSSGSLRLASLELSNPGGDEPGLQWESLALKEVSLDSRARRLEIGDLSVASPGLVVRRLPQGLQVAGFRPADGDEPAPDGEDQPDDEEPAWQVLLREIAVENGRLQFRDETLREPGTLELTSVNLEAENISPGSDRPFRFQGELGLAGVEGRLGLSGEGTLAPLVTVVNTESEGLGLQPFQPWLTERARLAINGGELSPALSVTLTDSGGRFTTRVTGDVDVSGLALAQTDGDNRMSLASLAVRGLVLDTGARKLALEQVTLEGLDGSAVVDEQGRGVAGQVLVPANRATPETGDTEEPWTFQLGQMALGSSQLAFRDRSVSPTYRVDLAQLSGGLSDVDSASGAAGNLRLKASIDQYAPLSITGSVKARPGNNLTQLKLSLSGYEMTGLTPYTARYLGYKVQSGQLALDADASLQGTMLKSSTQFRADNFYLGDSVPGEDAVKAPLRVGLAVLRNRDGVVALPVNISGDLGDPSVSVRGLVLQTLGNVLVKAATSPFSVLAGLVGTSEKLDHIPFDVGTAGENESTRKRLEVLAQALARRPRLRLDLTGIAVPADRHALAVERVARRQAMELGLEWSGLGDALENEAFREAVNENWRLQTGASSRASPATDQDGQWARTRAALQALAESSEQAVAEESLVQLAAQRARRAKTLLVEAHGVDAERLFIQDPVVAKDAEPGVRLSLEAP